VKRELGFIKEKEDNYPMQTKRKLAKKFGGKDLTKRLERKKIKISRPDRENCLNIINGAEAILRTENPEKKRLIFVGQGMRPLFEAVRGLNQIDGAIPRRNIRYFVSLKSKHTLLGKKSQVRRTAKKIGKLGIVSNGIEEYLVFDYSGQGDTFRTIQKAIRKLKPRAKVSNLHQKSTGEVGRAILFAQNVSKPTVKDANANLSENPFLVHKNAYLSFQAMLHDYLRARLPRKKIFG